MSNDYEYCGYIYKYMQYMDNVLIEYIAVYSRKPVGSCGDVVDIGDGGSVVNEFAVCTGSVVCVDSWASVAVDIDSNIKN